jgi:capsular exopolysaccharide synthesis family protein
LRQLEVERQRSPRISLASAAAPPTEPAADRRAKFTILALLGSVFLAVSVALLLERLDASVRVPADLQRHSQLCVLGTVPRLKDLLSGQVGREEFAEGYRIIRTCLFQVAEGSMPRSLLITSAHGGEGKTGVAVSLAASIAETGQRVLLIDGDIRKPDIGQSLRLPDCDRLASALLAQRPLQELTVPSAIDNLEVLPATPGNGQTTQLLTSRRVKRLLGEAVELYDMVIVDSPPVLAVADSLVWAGAVDGVICSVLAGRSNRTAVWNACHRLQQVNARILGTVVGNFQRPGMRYGYGYGYGYDYHRSGASVDRRKKRRHREQEAPPLVVLPGEEDDQKSS